VPNVPVMFFLFRFMAGLGFGFIAFFAASFYCASTSRFRRRWFLKLAVFMIPLPWLAIEFGWVLAEIGRQPWAVDGVLPTFLGASSLTVPQIWTTIFGFTALYGTLAVIEVRLMIAAIRKGRSSIMTRQPAMRALPRCLRNKGADAMHIPLDYETLRLIWWVLLGVLLIGFALTDGYDLGVASLLPFVARSDEERRQAINAIAPHWEGHQVWLILGGGAIFAAWPFVYAVSFSGFYLAMFLVLASLILRPVSFKYRSKHADPAWRSRWDMALFVGGFVPALVFGVAVGNVLAGAPFRFDSDLRMTYEGSLLGLFTPFTLLAGLLSVAMLAMHGAAWLAVKIEEGPVLERARRFGRGPLLPPSSCSRWAG
jgi:hypothetical protein